MKAEAKKQAKRPEVGTKRKVSIVPLKRFAAEKLPHSCALREVILAESDELEAEEFLAKMDVWLKLLSAESS